MLFSFFSLSLSLSQFSDTFKMNDLRKVEIFECFFPFSLSLFSDTFRMNDLGKVDDTGDNCLVKCAHRNSWTVGVFETANLAHRFECV